MVLVFFPPEVDLRGLGMQVCTVVRNVLSGSQAFPAIVSPQRLGNVLGSKIVKTKLKDTLLDGWFLPSPSQGP